MKTTYWMEKIFTNDMTDRGLVSKIYSSCNSISKKDKQLYLKKMSFCLNIHFSRLYTDGKHDQVVFILRMQGWFNNQKNYMSKLEKTSCSLQSMQKHIWNKSMVKITIKIFSILKIEGNLFNVISIIYEQNKKEKTKDYS